MYNVCIFTVRGICTEIFILFYTGKLFVKSHADDSEREITLLKSSISPEDITTGSVMPDILPPGGITSERQRYLFRVVRPFVRDPFKDTTCLEAEE